MVKEKKCECEVGAPTWMVTYGDLMSLLLTFFVLLLSFATMEEPKRYEATMLAIRGAFGVLPNELTTVRMNPLPSPQQRPSKAEEDLARRIRRRLQIIHKEDDVNIEFAKSGGLKINLPSQILFDTGRSELKSSAYTVLNDLGELLSELPDAFFEVRGHTDDRGLAGESAYRDNYDLSFARADAVARFINQTSRISMEHFEIVACGAAQPVAPNTTPEGQAANRRVEIWVKGVISDSQTDHLKSSVQRLTEPLLSENGRAR